MDIIEWLIDYASREPVDATLPIILVVLFRDRIFGGHRLGEYSTLLANIHQEIGKINGRLDALIPGEPNSEQDQAGSRSTKAGT